MRNGGLFTANREGSDFPNLGMARVAAIAAAREFISQSVLAEGRLGLDRRIEIADITGNTLLIVSFRDAVRFDD
jgi:hypothetical protein